MMKRIIATFLCVLLAAGTFPGTSSAAEIAASGQLGDGFSWRLETDGTLYFGGTGGTEDVPADAYTSFASALFGSQAKTYNHNVVFEDGTTVVNSLLSLVSPETVSLPQSVTAVQEYAFATEDELSSALQISSALISLLQARIGCDSLRQVYFRGTQAQWDEVEIGPHNTMLLQTKLHTADHPVVLVREDVTEATCISEGHYIAVEICSACGIELARTSVTVPAADHTPTDAVRENVTDATCAAEGGYDEVVYCAVCGAELSREAKPIPVTAHTPAPAVRENEKDATCAAEGGYDEVVYCAMCGAELSREAKAIPLSPHTPAPAVRENEKDASCAAEGGYDEVVYCAVCGAELSREAKPIPVTAHTPAPAVRENEKDATCAAEGGYDEVVYCAVCKAELSREAKAIPLAPHTPAPAVRENEKDATCAAEGGYDEVVYCAVCGAELSREAKPIPVTAHTPAPAVRENEKDATCAAEGGYDYVVYCTDCGAEISRTRHVYPIDKNAHAYGAWTVQDADNHQKICANDPAHFLTEPHEWDGGSVTREPTYAEDGERTFTCTICGAQRKETLPMRTPSVAEDRTNGVGVSYRDDAFAGAISVKATPILPPEVKVALLKDTYAFTEALEIKTTCGGKSAQPETDVTVSIPLPEGCNARQTAVYLLDGDKNATEMAVDVTDGLIRFTTSGLGVFVIVDRSTKILFELGKVDRDDRIGAADARLALRASVGLETYLPFTREFSAADIDNDGKISAADARMILRASVGLSRLS